MKTSVVRKITFHSAHRLHNPNWNDTKNKEVFGLCANPNYHGHNYDLLFKVTGEVNPETGFVMDLKDLSDLLNKEISERFDHRNLNLDVPEFKNLNPTAENIAKVVYDIMRPKINTQFDIQVTLYETPRNFVIYPD
ncbi:MAG TPA: 6-carboxytetrahydropterin synthase [Bacteroidia bacterium]|nr:6-carboxytetrahydropterin synthase [Bacteroidia bacterium]HRD38381.1 6-carboxytetrahydropterin synthase [Bacteroidia bacterium]